MVSSAVKPVWSLLLMPMKLNPFRIPELRDLPDTVSRQEVVRSVKRRMWWRILLVDWFFCVALAVAAIIMMIIQPASVLSWIWVIFAAFAVPSFVYHRRPVRRIQIREIMRTEHQIPICVNCGYQVASMETQTCPECGKPVDGKKRAK